MDIILLFIVLFALFILPCVSFVVATWFIPKFTKNYCRRSLLKNGIYHKWNRKSK